MASSRALSPYIRTSELEDESRVGLLGDHMPCAFCERLPLVVMTAAAMTPPFLAFFQESQPHLLLVRHVAALNL